MAIVYKLGDLLEAPQKVLIHGCNACGVQNSGVAKVIREKWPEVYDQYRSKFTTSGLSLGENIPVLTNDGKIVVNCVTQLRFGGDGKRYASYDAIASCFEQLNKDAVDLWKIDEIAMPRLGAGLGGGKWSIIEEIINSTSTNFTPVVYDLPITK